jgi:hypothetical protein
MDFRPTSDEQRAWWRIVASLIAFAGLAEQAACRSWPVRWLVLSILGLAEDIVADLVFDAAGLPPPDFRESPAGHTPGDALVLAARFMALAVLLTGLIRESAWHDRWRAPRRLASGGYTPEGPMRGFAPGLNDTS